MSWTWRLFACLVMQIAFLAGASPASAEMRIPCAAQMGMMQHAGADDQQAMKPGAGCAHCPGHCTCAGWVTSWMVPPASSAVAPARFARIGFASLPARFSAGLAAPPSLPPPRPAA